SSGQPVGITAGFPAIAVAAGYAHSLSLYMGRVTSWGANDKGQAGGFGFATDSPQPRLDVRGPGGDGILSGVKAIAAGESHSLALKADGTVWAWGANGQGQLGTNSRTDMGAPVQVHGLTYDSMLSDIVAIAAGRQFSLALRADGAVFVWGRNDKSQLSRRHELKRSRAPLSVYAHDGDLPKMKAIAAGAAHGLALTADGK